MIATNNNSIFLFGYTEQHLPEAEIENEADLFFYCMANDLSLALSIQKRRELKSKLQQLDIEA